MKKNLSIFAIFVSLSLSVAAQAQDSYLDQFNFIAEQAQAIEPQLFPSPGPEVQQVEAMGASWLAQYYASTAIWLALNIDDETIYTLGGPWPEPTLIDSLGNILSLLGYVPPDDGGGDSGGDNGGDDNGGGDTGGDGSGNFIVTQGGVSCVDLTDAVQNTMAMYQGQQSVELETGVTNGTISYTTTYTNVTSNSVTTETDQSISAGGFTANSESTTTSYFERANGWLYNTETDSEVTTTFPGFPASTSTTNITYTPPQAASPLQLCNGMIFRIGEVTSTTTSTAGGISLPPTSAQTSESLVETISVNESITVPAGTFSTVHQIIEDLDDNDDTEGYSEAWFINSAGGVPARIDFYQTMNGMDTLISSVELQSLSIP